MTLPSLLLLGCGGHARACIDVIEEEGRFTVAGLVGLPTEVGTRQMGYPVIGSDDDLPDLCQQFTHVLVCAGQIRSPALRARLFDAAMAAGASLPSVISPRAYVSAHAKIGAGSIVMHGAIVNAAARVGRNCIINTRSLVEHDAEVMDNCHIATSSTLNGGVSVGAGTFIGSGAVVREAVVIGAGCVIGMGERVLADCAPGTFLARGRPVP